MPSAEEIIARLGLEPLKIEGGFFSETYRCPETVKVGRRETRSLGSAIYYLLRAGDVSLIHRLPSDEIFHFYAGDPVEMVLLGEAGRSVVLGPDVLSGMEPQVLVPRGTWQGCRVKPGGAWALMGTTVSPGFAYEDYEAGDGAELRSRFPQFSHLIAALAP